MLYLENRNSTAGRQAPDISHTLGFKSSSYQQLIPFQTADNVPELDLEFEEHCIRTCSICTFLFYFYLTFKRIFLPLSNLKKRKQDLESLLFSSLQPPVQAGIAYNDFCPQLGKIGVQDWGPLGRQAAGRLDSTNTGLCSSRSAAGDDMVSLQSGRCMNLF